jgi:hypothetical protein
LANLIDLITLKSVLAKIKMDNPDRFACFKKRFEYCWYPEMSLRFPLSPENDPVKSGKNSRPVEI